ncbi:MAG: enoyl-CoA hydratase-related protein [Armatimonadota bacterium]|nr:enoyl-CoA hydratase-related protein [Armatimonadota bacterium]MDR7422580.1 enoyl-CoA hydratase-related protein [Armatimonadota bacterium]MDR7453921.1 enoyl-CoA hydratase-related protein [Armatimonadota bacterium]MDR7457665.1 enoyl-CoA hydratase-related protein [Armatimonadota bacterium]MDR7511028.1 enoyl-CoA hydratase-related protein [Armatimonadota bacterium]
MRFCTVERDGHLIVVTLNRPEVRNALHREATDELDAVWDAFEADPELRVAVLTGAGDRAFCAGYDVRASSERRGAAFLADRHPRGIGGLTHRFDLTKPVVAAVNGYALGGGFELALACDLIVAAEHAEFGFPEPRLGLMAMDGGMHRLARQVPLKLAMSLLLTGRRVRADEAARIGFVNEVVPLADLLATARRWAALMLECAPLSVRGTKEMTMAGLDLPLPAAMGLLTPAASRAMASADQDEGVAAFREKRAPRWTGR